MEAGVWSNADASRPGNAVNRNASSGVGTVAAVLVPACFAMLLSPPYGWLWLHPFVFVLPLWVFFRGEVTGRRAFLLGWAGGFVIYLVLFPWLPRTVENFSHLPLVFGVLGYVVYAAISALFFGVFAWSVPPLRRASGPAWPIATAAWFTACEFLNPQVIPFYQAVPWYEVSSLFLVVSLLGMPAGTFLVILANAVVLQGVELLRARERRALTTFAAFGLNSGVLIAALAFAFAVSSQRLAVVARAEADAGSIRVAIVQTNLYGEPRRELIARGGAAAVARDWIELSQPALESHGPIDVFVWAESALSDVPSAAGNAAVLAYARATRAEIWTGAGYSGRLRDGPRRPFNAAFRIDAEGRVHPRYDKIALIPLGEYVPMTEAIPALGRIPGLGRYLPGQRVVVHAAAAPFAFLICYEAIVPARIRASLDAGAHLLVNLTFDGWFGDTAAPHQHLMLAAAQAAQFGVPMVRSAGTGISAFIDAGGVIRARAGLFVREVLVGDVALVHVPSAYSVHGDVFAWGCALLCAGLFARAYATRGALRDGF